MKRWVLTFRVEPPTGCTVSAANGPSLFFAAYSKWMKQWFMVYPGGEEKIDEPQMIYVEEQYAKDHPRDFSRGRRPTIKLREGKLVQYELGL